MKKFVLSISFFFLMLSAFSQSDKYLNAMMSKVALIDSTRNVDSLKDLSAAFERIADAEKTQWLPYYYAALTQVNSGYMMGMSNGAMSGGMADKLDPVADKADQMINKAEELSKDNSEIYIVKKMIATLRMMADPMNRYMQYGPQAQEALDKAKQLNPDNPRVYLLEGEDKMFTPEQYGGSKEEAKKLFEQAIQKYDSFKPASSIDPNWGRHTTEYFLSQIKA
jgi:tetratricopeptide (TPR) repeat protein